MAYTWGLLASDWDSLTVAEKYNLLNSTGYNKPTLAELSSLGKFKIISYNDLDYDYNIKINGIPNDKIVIPKALFGTYFDTIDNISVIDNVSGSSMVRFAITKDLVNYYTYSSSEGFVKIDIEDIFTDGMTTSTLNSITDIIWGSWYNKSEFGDAGIGIAFGLQMNDISNNCEVDNIDLVIDAQGSWEKAILGTDYNYGYVSNDTLRVSLLTDGTYKINYA